MTEPMDKRFEPASYEQKWQRDWAERGIFVAAPDQKPAFCLMIPPPNVTGRLHMGHALQTTLQDVLVRWRRMCGDNALWVPGTDHAGIATQLMVERELAKEGTSRKELGREAFLERVWAWKEEHSDHIRRQLEMLGASCDFTRERFTMDEGLSRAVRHAFVQLYREGNIRRGDYMVNWSPVLETAISDLEVESRSVEGHLYHVAYQVEGSDERIVVATTRPETMLGDTAVAMHPEDERYLHLAGRHAILPLVGRRLPFVADAMVDREFGTGLVKITPYHDPRDFELAQRHDLPGIQVIDLQGKMTAAAGERFAGLSREGARALVLEELRNGGYLVKVEKHVHNVGHSQRSGEAIEPMLSRQWFCDVRDMAARALASTRAGELRFFPDTWDKTWEHWLTGIRPWCISRQLWWGHQIPAWYTADGQCFVAESFEEAAEAAGTRELTQDPDVLDTWFSSALWPFSTLGWPEKTPDLATFYPTDVLVTGFDILFFWVARMVMAGLHFTGTVPFHTVHLTGLVRDKDGQKMSKTKGNVVFPDDLIAIYGADAVRFTLASLDSPGRDIPLNPDQIAGYRGFGNKIWNAARFALSRTGETRIPATLDDATLAELALPERWILSRLSRTTAEVREKLGQMRFDEACNRLYHFFWHELCDWYLELAKPALFGDAPRPHVSEVLMLVLDRSLRLLHPTMPFLTEEIWQRLPGHEAIDARSIALAPFPAAEPAWESAEAEAQATLVMDIVTRVRSLRTELGIPVQRKVHVHLDAGDDAALAAVLTAQAPLVTFLCRVADVQLGHPADAVGHDRVGGVDLALVTEAEALGAEERQRLEGERDNLETAIAKLRERLADEKFVTRAPEKVVEGERQRLREMEQRHARLVQGLAAAAARE